LLRNPRCVLPRELRLLRRGGELLLSWIALLRSGGGSEMHPGEKSQILVLRRRVTL
jgi:hypothetical protein